MIYCNSFLDGEFEKLWNMKNIETVLTFSEILKVKFCNKLVLCVPLSS